MDGFTPLSDIDGRMYQDREAPAVPLAQLVLDQGNSGIAILDQACHCLYANREMAAILGCPAADITGHDFRIHVAEASMEPITGPAKPAVFGPFDAVFHRKDGSTRTVEATVMDLIVTTGAPLRVIYAFDISNHKHMSEELAESERKYRLLVENIEEFFFEQSIEGGFVFFNEALVRHSGFTREELSTMNFRDYILPEDWDRVVAFYSTILKTGEPASGLLIRGRMKDGSIHYYEVKSNLKTDETGRSVGFRSYSRDVTAEILYEKEMKKMHMALEENVKERTRELQDINTALEVLLKKRENDKKDLENRVAFSIKEVIAPHIELLKKTALDKHQAIFLEILEQNFQEICSPFMQILSESMGKLTPMEIQVVNLIKQNKSSKQIADFLGISPRTVEFHRDNIRKKLGIKNKKQNLRTYLLSRQ